MVLTPAKRSGLAVAAPPANAASNTSSLGTHSSPPSATAVTPSPAPEGSFTPDKRRQPDKAGTARTATSPPPVGVYMRASGRWSAGLTWKGEKRHLGTFDTAEQATAALAEAKRRLGVPVEAPSPVDIAIRRNEHGNRICHVDGCGKNGRRGSGWMCIAHHRELEAKKASVGTGTSNRLTTAAITTTTLPRKPIAAGAVTSARGPDGLVKRPNVAHHCEVEVKKASELSTNDVVMGRGGLSNHHVGNNTFRTLTASLKTEYARLSKDEKTDVSHRLLKMVHARGGKFLAKDSISNLFYEVDYKIARRKCSQALREESKPERAARKSRAAQEGDDDADVNTDLPTAREAAKIEISSNDKRESRLNEKLASSTTQSKRQPKRSKTDILKEFEVKAEMYQMTKCAASAAADAEKQKATLALPTKKAAQALELPPKSDWKEAIDPSTGKPYYYHVVSNEVTWDKPACLAAQEVPPFSVKPTKKPKGITQLRDNGKWKAQINVAGKRKYIGNFDVPEEGTAAYELVRTALDESGLFPSEVAKKKRKADTSDATVPSSSVAVERKKCEQWTAAEDRRLRTIVAKVQQQRKDEKIAISWIHVAQAHGGTRTPKQVRERWLHVLDPNRKHGKWTHEEIALVIRLQKELGNQWSDISDQLPGRSSNDVKNKWHGSKKIRRHAAFDGAKLKAIEAAPLDSTKVPATESDLPVKNAAVSATKSGTSSEISEPVSEWRETIDEASGKPYYYHTATQEVTWDKPSCLAAQNDPAQPKEDVRPEQKKATKGAGKSKYNQHGLPLGVTKSASNKFRVQFSRFGKVRDIGSFSTPEEAAVAYQVVREELDSLALSQFNEVLFEAAKARARVAARSAK